MNFSSLQGLSGADLANVPAALAENTELRDDHFVITDHESRLTKFLRYKTIRKQLFGVIISKQFKVNVL